MNENTQYHLMSTASRIYDACDALEETITRTRNEFAAAGITFEDAGISEPVSALLSNIAALRGSDLSV